jgi:hypothetical protein
MPHSERRTSPRVQQKSCRVLIIDPEDGLQEPYLGWVVDRSEGGLCLAFQRIGLKVGDVFLVELAPDSEAAAWVAVRVKNGRWRNNRLELGCEFVPDEAMVVLQ